MTSPIDPDDLDPTRLGQPAGLPEPVTPSRDEESLRDVLGRVSETAAQLPDGPLATSRPGSGAAVTEVSDVGEVEASARDHRLVGLRLDQTWLREADPAEVERLVLQTVNRALDTELDRVVTQMMSGGIGQDGLAGRIAALQTEAHDAFRHDLARVSAPAHETVRRMGGAS